MFPLWFLLIGLGPTLVFFFSALPARATPLFMGLGDLPGGSFGSVATGVSADGSVVVGQSQSASGFEVFVWDSTNGMRELDQVLTNQGIDLTGWTLWSAEGVSHDGLTIVGYGTNPSNAFEAWIAVIPEPSTALLLASGLGALAVGRSATRRREHHGR